MFFGHGRGVARVNGVGRFCLIFVCLVELVLFVMVYYFIICLVLLFNLFVCEIVYLFWF